MAVTAPSRSRSRPTTGVRCNCDCVSFNRSTTFRPPTGVPRSSNVSFNLVNINLVRSVVSARHPPTPPPLTNSSFFRIPVYLVLGALSTSTSTPIAPPACPCPCPCLPQLLASRNATPRTPAFFGVTDRERPVTDTRWSFSAPAPAPARTRTRNGLVPPATSNCAATRSSADIDAVVTDGSPSSASNSPSFQLPNELFLLCVWEYVWEYVVCCAIDESRDLSVDAPFGAEFAPSGDVSAPRVSHPRVAPGPVPPCVLSTESAMANERVKIWSGSFDPVSATLPFFSLYLAPGGLSLSPSVALSLCRSVALSLGRHRGTCVFQGRISCRRLISASRHILVLVRPTRVPLSFSSRCI